MIHPGVAMAMSWFGLPPDRTATEPISGKRGGRFSVLGLGGNRIEGRLDAPGLREWGARVEW